MRGEVPIRHIISAIRKDSVVVNHLNEEFSSPYIQVGKRFDK